MLECSCEADQSQPPLRRLASAESELVHKLFAPQTSGGAGSGRRKNSKDAICLWAQTNEPGVVEGWMTNH